MVFAGVIVLLLDLYLTM